MLPRHLLQHTGEQACLQRSFPRIGMLRPLPGTHVAGSVQLSSQLRGSYLIEEEVVRAPASFHPRSPGALVPLRWLSSSLLCLLIREHKNVCACFSPLAQHGCKTVSLCISCMLIAAQPQRWGFEPSDRGAQGMEHSFSITQYIFKGSKGRGGGKHSLAELLNVNDRMACLSKSTSVIASTLEGLCHLEHCARASEEGSCIRATRLQAGSHFHRSHSKHWQVEHRSKRP